LLAKAVQAGYIDIQRQISLDKPVLIIAILLLPYAQTVDIIGHRMIIGVLA
jgi:hypothetical protein